MSPSDEAAGIHALAQRVEEVVERTIQGGGVARVAIEDVTRLTSSAVRLYAAVTEELEREIPVTDRTISTTEAMVVACALLRAQHLNPFDLALWFSRTAPRAADPAQGA